MSNPKDKDADKGRSPTSASEAATSDLVKAQAGAGQDPNLGPNVEAHKEAGDVLPPDPATQNPLNPAKHVGAEPKPPAAGDMGRSGDAIPRSYPAAYSMPHPAVALHGFAGGLRSRDATAAKRHLGEALVAIGQHMARGDAQQRPGQFAAAAGRPQYDLNALKTELDAAKAFTDPSLALPATNNPEGRAQQMKARGIPSPEELAELYRMALAAYEYLKKFWS